MSAGGPAEVFLQEAADLLEQLKQAPLELAAKPGDRDLVINALRALHTVKGSGAMVGFEQVAAFAHEFESAFERVRQGEAAATPELIAIALNAQDFLRAQIERPNEAEPLISVSDDGRGLDAARIRAKAEENGLIAPGATMSEIELHQLLFQPGFSTASRRQSASSPTRCSR